MAEGAAVAETPEELYRRALAAADDEGRLPLPPLHEWETFPFDGDLQTRPLLPPLESERPRLGDGGAECWRCERGDADAL